MRALTLTLLFISLFFTCSGQDQLPEQLGWLRQEQGLSSNSVTALAQDERGFLWIGTSDGLNRYDGSHVKTYFRNINGAGLPHNSVSALKMLPGNRLLIGTRGGICIYNTEEEEWKQFYLWKGDGFDSYYNTVHGLNFDSNGDIWVACKGALLKLGQELNLIKSYTYNTSAKSKYRVSFAANMIPLRDGDMLFWFLAGLQVYDASGDTLIPVAQSKYSELEALNFKLSYQMKPLWPGFILIFPTSDDSLRVYNLAEKRICNTSFLSTNTYPHIDWRQNVWTLDSTRLVITLNDFGYLNIDVTWQNGSPGLKVNSNIKYANIEWQGSYADRAGSQWMYAVNKGLMLVDNHKSAYSIVPLPNSNTGKQSKSIVNHLWIDKGSVYASTYGNGLYITSFDSQNDYSHELSAHIPTIRSTSDVEIDQFWQAKYIGHDTLWLATQQGVFWKISDIDIWTPAALHSTRPAVMDSVAITTLFHDSEGFVWMGLGEGNGVARWNSKTGIYKHYTGKSTEGYPGRYPLSIIEDMDQNLWMLSDDTGDLYRWIRADDTFETISLTRILGSPFGTAQDFTFDSRGNLWITSEFWGLLRFDPTAMTARMYDRTYGLDNTYMSKLAVDHRDRIWTVTSSGISVFLPTEEKFINLNLPVSNNPSSGFSSVTYHPASNTMYAGSEGAFISFSPDEMLIPTPPHRPLITEIILDDANLVFPGSKIDPVKPHNKAIEFHFVSVDIKGTKGVRYAYRLHIDDTMWTSTGTQNHLLVRSLEPGSYSFQVKAINERGEWSEPSEALTFYITPPFVRTPWFYLCIAVFIAIIFYSIYKYRYAQLLKMNKIRSEISKDLHDDIGSNLTNISLTSMLARRKAANEPAVQELLDKIHHDSVEVSNSIREIVWSVNPENDKLDNAWPQMLRYASEILESKNISISVEAPEDFNGMRLEMGARRDFILIFKEAVHNIAKHSCANRVDIHINKADNKMKFIISDNGSGFDSVQLHRRSGLENMKSRAVRNGWEFLVQSKISKGTTITLSLNTT